MGDGTEENPLTREDVLRLIEENGGKAEGLDLSRKVFEANVDLGKLFLQGIILNEASLIRANFQGAQLEGAHLKSAELTAARLDNAILVDAHFEGARLGCIHIGGSRREGAQLKGALLLNAHLEAAILSSADLTSATMLGAHLEKAHLANANLQGALMSGAHLEEASLIYANLEDANLTVAHLDKADLAYAYLKGTDFTGAFLEGARLTNVRLSSDTLLQKANWGDYFLAEEIHGSLDWAEDTYRRLKQWYTNAGVYDVAGKFFYREMEAKRKAQGWKKKPHLKLWNWVMRMLCGYGEKPERVVISAAVVVLGLALIYFAIGTLEPATFLNSLHYSAVSFTALGYGSWVPEPPGWVKGLGAAEAFAGVFMIALFLITFTRKMTR